MRWSLLVLLGSLLAGAAGDGDAPEARPAWMPAGEPTVASPLPFDHGEHRGIFASAGIVCLDCHGFAPLAQAPAAPALGETCHGCHLQELPGAPRAAPRTCATCHTVPAELRPQSHAVAWLTEHALEARAPAATCRDCHDTSECLDCHDRRGAGSTSPHPPAFRAVHGLDAQMDPASCTSCHAAATCEACHTAGGMTP